MRARKRPQSQPGPTTYDEILEDSDLAEASDSAQCRTPTFARESSDLIGSSASMAHALESLSNGSVIRALATQSADRPIPTSSYAPSAVS